MERSQVQSVIGRTSTICTSVLLLHSALRHCVYVLFYFRSLKDNQFSGSLPLAIGKLKSIAVLYVSLTLRYLVLVQCSYFLVSRELEDNLLTGTIPGEIFLNIPYLEKLYLAKCITQNCLSSNALFLSSVHENFLTGTIPSQLSKTIVASLNLYNNSFFGCIGGAYDFLSQWYRLVRYKDLFKFQVIILS